MIPLLLVVLAQTPTNGLGGAYSNPIMVKDEGALRSTSRATTINCTGAGVTCTQAGQTMTLNVPGGGGPGGGGSPVDAGYVYWGTHSTGSTNERKLSTGNYTTVDVGTAGEVQLDWAHGLTCSAGQAMTSSGTTALQCTSTLTASDVACAGTCVADGEISGVAGSKVSGAVSTASALAANPADCTAGQYATTIAANGDLTCAQVSYAQVSGTPTIPADISGASYITKVSEASLSNEFAMGSLGTGLVINTTTTGVPSIKGSNTCTNQFPRSDNASGTWTCASIATADLPTVTVGKGGTGQTTITTNQVYVGTALDTLAAKTLPSCSSNTTDKLLFDSATQTWSCGTDQGGAGSGLSFAEISAARLIGAF